MKLRMNLSVTFNQILLLYTSCLESWQFKEELCELNNRLFYVSQTPYVLGLKALVSELTWADLESFVREGPILTTIFFIDDLGREDPNTIEI